MRDFARLRFGIYLHKYPGPALDASFCLGLDAIILYYIYMYISFVDIVMNIVNTHAGRLTLCFFDWADDLK